MLSPSCLFIVRWRLLPFANRDDLLWQVLVGDGDQPYRRTTKAAWCLDAGTLSLRMTEGSVSGFGLIA